MIRKTRVRHPAGSRVAVTASVITIALDVIVERDSAKLNRLTPHLVGELASEMGFSFSLYCDLLANTCSGSPIKDVSRPLPS